LAFLFFRLFCGFLLTFWFNSLIIKDDSKKKLTCQGFSVLYMSELRKLLRLTSNAYAVTIPTKYRKAMQLGPGNYVEMFLVENKTLIIKKHKELEKP
jgi:hypothetical protein